MYSVILLHKFEGGGGGPQLRDLVEFSRRVYEINSYMDGPSKSSLFYLIKQKKLRHITLYCYNFDNAVYL